jgi:Tfp pilus assembly protein PilN
MTTDLRSWLAIGTGVGIEIGDEELQISIARVRPNGIAVLGSATVVDVRNRPAAEWGAELQAFLKELGCGHIPAAVLLPRRDVIVRQVALPGVTDRDLPAAIQLQIDALHPFAEDEVAYSFARIGKTSFVLVGITRREVVERYTNLFAEAGIKITSFTFSAAAIYSALRILGTPPNGFVAVHPVAGELEVYGESESRPVFSATFDAASSRAITQAIAELRLPPDVEPVPLEQILPKPSVFPPNHDPESVGFGKHAMPYATAVGSACPWLSLQANLLPVELRKSSSRIRLIPTVALGCVLLLMVTALAAHSSYENARYLARLRAEIKRIEPQANKVQVLDRGVAATRARTKLLDDFRRRSKSDMDALNELTKLLQPPTWLSTVEIRRNGIQISGETEQAATLLQIIDNSPMFTDSSFTTSPTRVLGGEVFGIKATREGAGQ